MALLNNSKIGNIASMIAQRVARATGARKSAELSHGARRRLTMDPLEERQMLSLTGSLDVANIDDILVFECVEIPPPPEIFDDGFEAGDVSVWSSSVGGS